jgi:hypothetical protein
MTPEERELLERTRKELAKLEAKARASAAERELRYSPEVIHRYRELRKAGEFKRTITARTAVEPDMDELTLECGHTCRMLIIPITDDYLPGTLHSCPICEKAWLREAAGGETK